MLLSYLFSFIRPIYASQAPFWILFLFLRLPLYDPLKTVGVCSFRFGEECACVAHGSEENHATKSVILPKSEQKSVKFWQVFKKHHTRKSKGGYFFLQIFVLFTSSCYATTDETPECEKNWRILLVYWSNWEIASHGEEAHIEMTFISVYILYSVG